MSKDSYFYHDQFQNLTLCNPYCGWSGDSLSLRNIGTHRLYTLLNRSAVIAAAAELFAITKGLVIYDPAVGGGRI